MSDETTQAGAGAEGDASTAEPRQHPQDPAEGAPAEDTAEADQPRAHPQDPAEGPDDESATD